MKPKNLLIFFALLSITLCANAQVKMIADKLVRDISSTMIANGARIYSAEGTPYLQDEFVNGTVYSNEQKYSEVPLRYNIYEDQIEFKQNSGYYVLNPEPRIDSVRIDQYKFLVENFGYGGKRKFGFVLLLESGSVKLFSRKIVTFKEAQPAKPMQYESSPAKLSREPDVFYIKLDKGDLMEIESMKKLLALFPNRQEELNSFVKKEKLSANKESDLMKLVHYYNTL